MFLQVSYIFTVICAILEVINGANPILPPKIAARVVRTRRITSIVEMLTLCYDSNLKRGLVINHRAGETDTVIFDYYSNNYGIKNILTIDADRKLCQSPPNIDPKTMIDPKQFFQDLTSKMIYKRTNTYNDINVTEYYSTSTANYIRNSTITTAFTDSNWTFPNSFNGDWSRPLYTEYAGIITPDMFEFSDVYYFMDFTDVIPDNIYVPPPMVNCPKFATNKLQPALTDEFQLEGEVHDKNDDKTEIKMYVNGKAQIEREDVRVVKDGYPHYITFITDSTFGIMYTLNTTSGKCSDKTALTLNKYSYDELTADRATSSLFLIQNFRNFQYAGNRDCGLGECEVWAATDRNTAYHEIYWKRSTQTVDGVRQNVDIPVRMDVSAMDTGFQRQKLINRQFYYNYESIYPDWSMFDITDCYNDTHMLRFQIQFEGDYSNLRSILDFEVEFVKAIERLTYLPAIRLHKIRVDTLLNAYIIVTATLLEDPQNTGLVGAFANRITYHDNNDFVYGWVSNIISDNRFYVEVKNATGAKVRFFARRITKDVLSEDKIDQMTSSLVKFTVETKKSLAPLLTDLTISETTVDECARQCEREESSTCDKFTFCRSTSSCTLTQYKEKQEPILNSDCDVYTRQYDYDYILFKGIRIKSGPSDTSAVTENLQGCFRDCFRNQNDSYACHSIDYCTDGKKHSCAFHTKHFVQTKPDELIPDVNCIHYSQNYIQMYHMWPGMQLENEEANYAIIKRDLVAWECAEHCTLDPNGCTDFEMCQQMEGYGRKTECRILVPFDKTKEPPKYVPTKQCDHYRYRGVKTDFNFDMLVFTEIPYVAPTEALKTEAFGGGDMAGLGIGMLLIGSVSGFVALYFYAKHQATRGNDQNLVMQLVK